MNTDTAGPEVPRTSWVEPMADWFRSIDAEWTTDMVQTALYRIGRNDGPALLLDLFLAQDVSQDEAPRRLSDEVLAAVIGGVWSGAEYPEGALKMESEDWITMFECAGYTEHGVRTERPAEPITLYRGAIELRNDGMAWTSSRAMAEKFATGGLRGREMGEVWTASVEPWRLLAKVGDRDEDEYVVNTDDLEIVVAGR